MSNSLIEQFAAVRYAGTPLVCIRTADPAATIKSIVKAQTSNGSTPPILHWDSVRGLGHVNKPGEQALSKLGIGPGSQDPIAALGAIAQLPGCTEDGKVLGSITFFANAHRIINENGVSQAIWNLRDSYKENMRTLVLLCPSIALPVELQTDVTMLDEPMPDLGELENIVKHTYKSAELTEPEAKVVTAATDAICGLAAFPAEQACAESLTRNGLNLPALWERKRKAVEQTNGLSIWRGTDTFIDVRGCDNAIDFLKRKMTGRGAARGIVWQDEIEKQFAGFGGDLSGTTGEAMGYELSWMQNHNASGILLIGPPGSGKSMLAQTCGNTFGKPTIEFNVSSTKAGIVGESEANMRQALKVIEAVTQGRALFIATCNKFGSLPPEFRRRFKDATFFCDLPSDEARAALWKLYIGKYKIPAKQATIPASEGWTGAEIKQCCALAWEFDCPLTETAKYIVPVCKSAAIDILQLRMQAHETFISAENEGVYQMPSTIIGASIVVDGGGFRKIQLPDKPTIN